MQLVVAPNRIFFVEEEFKRLLVQALRSKKKHGNFQYYYGPFFMLGLRFNRLHVNAPLLSKSSLFDINWSIESLLVPFIWSYPG